MLLLAFIFDSKSIFSASVASRFQISKYPTIKVLINGQPAKREYRGKRSVEAFVSFVQKQLEDPIQEVSSLFAAADVSWIIPIQ